VIGQNPSRLAPLPKLDTCRLVYDEAQAGTRRFYAPPHVPVFGSEELVQVGADYLSSQTHILRAICDSGNWGPRAPDLNILLMAFVSTPSALALLGAQDRLFNETVMLARPMFERVVNLCYSIVCDESDFLKIRDYTIHKAQEQLSREFRAGGEVVRAFFRSKSDGAVPKQGIKKSLRLKQQWNNGIPERLKIIGQRSQATIALFLLYQTAWYTDSSEALHGSFYGITCHLGIYEPRAEIPDIRNSLVNFNKTRALLLWLSGELLKELIKVVNREGTCSDLAAQAQSNSDVCRYLFSCALHSHDSDSTMNPSD
jgi:hypothetical protein